MRGINHFYDSLTSLQQIADSIADSLGSLGAGDKDGPVDQLKRIVSMITSRCQDIEFSYRMPQQTVQRALDGSLGLWNAPMTVCDLLWSCCIKLWNACVELGNLQRINGQESREREIPHKEAWVRHAVW